MPSNASYASLINRIYFWDWELEAQEATEAKRMNQLELTDLRADVKKLNARMTALEKLLERIIRQKPVSAKQLARALSERGVNGRRVSEC